MSNFHIFSDGSCDLTLTLAKEKKIKIIPFYVSLEQDKYQKELFELPLKEFYKKVIEEHCYPKTSLPSVQDYISAFTETLEQGKNVLCYTITDSLSGSYQSAMTAKQILEETYPKSKIYIVNSWLATGAQALLLFEACKMQEQGYSLEDIYQKTEELKKTGKILFMVGTLDYLEHGGRIGKIASLSGKILNIKPLIELKNAEINVAGVSQSRKKALKKLSSITKKFFETEQENPADYIFKIGTTNTWEEVSSFQQLLSTDIPSIEFTDAFQIGATIAAHTGPDTIGICFIKKFDKL